MKKLLFTLTLGVALAFGSQSAFAQAKKPAAPAADAPKAADAAKAKADNTDKPQAMNIRVDSIDATTKTLTQKRKDNVEVKSVVTAKTEIKNGDKEAKFEDIKVGDNVSGSRLKKSDTEYEVVKITKFGLAVKKPAAPKPAAPKADAPKPPAK